MGQIRPAWLGLGLPGRPFIPGLRVLKAGVCWTQTAGVGGQRPHEDPGGQRQEARTCGGKNPRFAPSTPASVYSRRGPGGLLSLFDLLSFSAKWVSFSWGVNDGASHSASPSPLGSKTHQAESALWLPGPSWVVFPGSLLPEQLGEQSPPRGTGRYWAQDSEGRRGCPQCCHLAGHSGGAAGGRPFQAPQ